MLQYSLSPFFPFSLSYGGSLTLYSSLWIILTLHLFIIWAPTWVPVPSDTLFGFLWAVVAKAALFRGFLHINVARKVVVMHLMRWQQLSLRYSWISFHLVCLWGTSPPLELLGRSFWLLEYILRLYTSHPRRNSSSDHLPFVSYSWDVKLELLTTICPFLDHSTSSDKAQSPIYYLGPLSLHIWFMINHTLQGHNISENINETNFNYLDDFLWYHKNFRKSTSFLSIF